MNQHRNRLLILSSYGIALVLFLYFGLNGLIGSIMGNTFPNVRFMTFLVLIIFVTWTIGLGVNRLIKEGNQHLKNSFLAVTVISWMIVLILFTVT